ncbi:MAG TPA: twin-arginine translocation signal domain-containing protein, partial [Candidatus Acidoferrum sp.]|nr:twin-arginine translocation signal domain-containing protein [Candidatus Acidoferrum sp.]
MNGNDSLRSGSRRAFLQLSAAATAAMAFRIATEASLAAEERNVFHPGAVVIDANENPLGPCDAARKAIVDMAPQGGRYSYWLKEEFVKTFTEMEGLKPEYLRVFPGSSEPLHFSVLAFTSPA